jgi:two-component sensor histidine kinase
VSDERFGEFVRNLPDVPWLYRVATDELAIVGRYDERHWGRPPPFGPGAARGLIEWVHPDDRAEVFATMSGLAVSAASAVTSHECRVVLPDGRVRWALTRAVPVHDEQGRAVEVAGYTVDVTERRDTELALRDHAVALERLVREKDVLLAEVHHRVKNNLQRITALLHLMAATSHGRSIRETVEELERRIEAMALAHETLYRSADLASVDMQAYLDRVARAQLGATGSPRRSIDVVVRAPDVRLDLDAALRCGLIVTELLSNSLKHAFGRRRRGRVEVALEPDGAGRLVLSVSDDGRGFPEGLGFTSEATLGLRLVGGLADQLGGAARRVRGATARIEIAFPAGG